jgi:hypothetical protein
VTTARKSLRRMLASFISSRAVTVAVRGTS